MTRPDETRHNLTGRDGTRCDATRHDKTRQDYTIASVKERRNLFINLGMMLADSDSQWLREACEMLLAIIPVTNTTRQDSTRRNSTGQDGTRQDLTRQDKT